MKTLYYLVFSLFYSFLAYAEAPDTSIFKSVLNDVALVDIYGVQMYFTREDLSGVQMSLLWSCSKQRVFLYLDEALNNPLVAKCLQNGLNTSLIGNNVGTVIRIDAHNVFVGNNQNNHQFFLGRFPANELPRFDFGAITINIAGENNTLPPRIVLDRKFPFYCYRYVSDDACLTYISSRDDRISVAMTWYKKDYEKTKWQDLRQLLFRVADVIFSEKYQGTFQ